MRLLVLCLALFSFLALSSVAHSQVMPNRVDESQGWHDDGRWKNDPTIGNESQEHNHMSCVLTDSVTGEQIQPLGKIVNRTWLDCELLGHNSTGFVEWIRWSCESDVKQVRDIDFRFTGAHEETIQAPRLTIDPSMCPNGWRELRITDNFNLAGTIEQGGGRFFHTTRFCVDFRAADGGDNYCGGPTQAGRCGGGGWYERTEYVLGLVDCRDLNKTLNRPLVAGDTIRVRSQGAPLWVNLDPKFHSFDVGTVMVNQGPGGTWHTVKVPSGLSAGLHKLTIRAQSNKTGEAGVYVLPFIIGDGGGTTEDTTPPSAPSNLRQVAATETSATMAWDASTDNVGVDHYRAFRQGELQGTTQELQFTYTGLACETNYGSGVDAVDAAGNISDRPWIVLTTAACGSDSEPTADTEAPTAPTNLRMVSNTSTSITLAWDASTDNVGVDHYDARVSGELFGTTSELQFTYEGLVCGSEHPMGVGANDAAGNESPQTWDWFSTTPC